LLLNQPKKRKMKNDAGGILNKNSNPQVQGPPKPDQISCPVCKLNNIILLYRGSAVLYRCRQCGIIFNQAFREISYNDDYFTDQYRKQYGRTYIEDFENIYRTSAGRLRRILKYRKEINDIGRLRLLDIGSASGFFLKAAQDSGIEDLLGIEISGFASGYCAEKLGINVINASFSEISLPGNFDIITAWYFIEHSPDPESIVTRIYNSLKQGGVFAFSVPSFFGPQFFFDRNTWFETHPVDHKTDFSPFSVCEFLKKIGFKKIYTFPAGIHPERIIKNEFILFPLFNSVYNVISRLISFSDTMEVYAVKI
jgi:SAM-dependent methyltransferase